MNPLAEVDIANMGLSYCGISTQIQSFNDTNEIAKNCKFWYSKCRDQLLQAAPWSFAFTCDVLASDATNVGPANTQGANFAFPGWKYGYVYPNPALQVVAITPLAGQRTGSIYWSNYWGGTGLPGYVLGIPKIPYKIVQSRANPQQKMIVCDLSPSAPTYCWYIAGVTDTSLFSPLFCEALAQSIGYRVGMSSRSSDKDMVAECKTNATMAKYSALAQALNEMQQDFEAESPSVIARR